MLTIAQLEEIAKARIEDAEMLSGTGRYDGAVYLCGYAVEVALKAKICTTLAWSKFPDRKNFESFYTHKLDVLLTLSGVESNIRSKHIFEWSVVAQWNEEARYRTIGSTNKHATESMISSAKIIIGAL